MRPEDFTNPPGKIIKTAEGYWAFIPAPLPSAIDLDLKTTNLLAEAERGMGELVGIGKRLNACQADRFKSGAPVEPC